MTPLEINKKIAEIKGYKYFEYEDSSNGIGIFKENDSKISANWAQNISDAWELFEEMPNSFVVTGKLNDGYYSCYSYICNPVIMERGRTAPLAICKAYLAWKGIGVGTPFNQK